MSTKTLILSLLTSYEYKLDCAVLKSVVVNDGNNVHDENHQCR
jgi:hypothetical protein